jgi:DNA-binding MarR family transcriptional regulator
VRDRPDVSLLFDLFVTSQRVRRVLTRALTGSRMRPDEYAVYSLLWERAPLTATEMAQQLGIPLTTALDYLNAMGSAGHIQRSPHPGDGRAVHVRLSGAGRAAHRRANALWEVARKEIEKGLRVPLAEARDVIRAIDDAALAALEPDAEDRRRRWPQS